MLINLDVVISSLIGAVFGLIFSLILVPLYSWALDQRESVRIIVILFVSFIGPFFIFLNKIAVGHYSISDVNDFSGYFFLGVGIIIFIVYGVRLKIFTRKPIS